MTERTNLQVIGECLVKAAHIILSSRIYQTSRGSGQQSAKEWFNLEIEEVQCAAAEINPWRKDVYTPLVLEVYLLPGGSAEEAPSSSTDATGKDSSTSSTQGETLLERWLLYHQPGGLPEGARMGRSASSRLDTAIVYKRMIITLRALYSYVRILPAYKIYRACKRSQGSNFSLGYSIKPCSAQQVVAMNPRLERFTFAPLDTPFGSLHIQVDYQPSAKITLLEQPNRAPTVTQVISDYIGGPSGPQRAGWARPTPRSSLSTSLSRPPQMAAAAPGQPAESSSLPATNAGGGAPGQAPKQPPLVRRHSWSNQTVRLPAPVLTAGGIAAACGPSSGPSPSPTAPEPLLQGSLGAQRWAPGTPSPSALHRTVSTPPKHPGSLAQRSASGGSPRYRAIASTAHRPPAPRAPSGLSPPGAGIVGTAPAAAVYGRQQPSGPGRCQTGGCTLASSSGVPRLAATPEDCVVGPSDRTASSPGRRQSSAPVVIPGAASAHARIHSSGDLWGLEQGSGRRRETSVAASAPPAAAMYRQHHPMATASDGRPCEPQALPSSSGAGEGRGSMPGTPCALQVLPSMGSETSSSASSSYPTSCSPQLPFAFTPSAHSYASLADPGGLASCWPGALSPSPPISGRDISALAVIRRPSWSARSSSFDPHQPPASGPLLGYSLSSMLDPLDTSLLSSSTPRQAGGPLLGLPSSPYHHFNIPAGSSLGYRPPRLTPPPAEAEELPMPLMEELEADVLPFALDGDPSQAAPCRSQPAAGAAGDGGDDIVGAFMHMIEQAPPLHSRLDPFGGHPGGAFGVPSGPTPALGQPSVEGCSRRPITLQAGMDQLARLKAKLDMVAPTALKS